MRAYEKEGFWHVENPATGRILRLSFSPPSPEGVVEVLGRLLTFATIETPPPTGAGSAPPKYTPFVICLEHRHHAWLREKDGKTWYSHQPFIGQWCNVDESGGHVKS